MDKKRWDELMNDDSKELTPEEVAQGWHWCWDWNGLLVGPGMKEQEACVCSATAT